MAVIEEIHYQVSGYPEFQNDAMLIFDESADEKAGEMAASVGRQHNGRLGKVEMSQVGVYVPLVTPRANTWIDGGLFLPEGWFEPSAAKRREKMGIPEYLCFQTKPELPGSC